MLKDHFDDAPFGAAAPDRFLAKLIQVTRSCAASWGGKRLAFALRRLGVALLDGPVDVQTLGVKMRLYPFNNVCEKRLLFTPQYFDPVERDHLASRIHEGFVFIDIGANVGGYALFVAGLAGPSARILAVEPQPEIHKRLVYNIRQNGFETVTAIGSAIADRDGQLEFFLSDDNQGQASLKDGPVETGVGNRITVPAVTLLSLLNQQHLDHVDAIKLDVEGAEDMVLEPFFRDAPTSLYPGLIIIENSPGRWRNDLLGQIESIGYQRLLVTRMNIIYQRN